MPIYTYLVLRYRFDHDLFQAHTSMDYDFSFNFDFRSKKSSKDKEYPSGIGIRKKYKIFQISKCDICIDTISKRTDEVDNRINYLKFV